MQKDTTDEIKALLTLNEADIKCPYTSQRGYSPPKMVSCYLNVIWSALINVQYSFERVPKVCYILFIYLLNLMTNQFICAWVEIIKRTIKEKTSAFWKVICVFFLRKAVAHSKTLRSHRSKVIETHVKGFLSD